MLTTVQDRGRRGYRAYGLPAAGAMDYRSLSLANTLLGNPPGTAALEITLLGPTLSISGSGTLALAGADLGARLNGWPLAAVEAFAVKAGDILSFTAPLNGCRSYLAIAGGFKLPQVLGSHSTYLRGATGGYQGRALRQGDILESAASSPTSFWQGALPAGLSGLTPPLASPHYEAVVRVLLGPQDDYFDSANIALFFESNWQVTLEADRMGYRLKGPVLQHKAKREIVSDGILPGAIQVPPAGAPIVLLADAQTCGGYPKIATVITADLGIFGQLMPGDSVQFAATTFATAAAATQAWESFLTELAIWLQRQQGSTPKRYRVRTAGGEHLVSIQTIS